ncbi:MAG: MarR family transcriptional regulator [Acidimicrobiales bacterium]
MPESERGRARQEAADRFMALQPAVMTRMADSVPDELRPECESVTAHQLKALIRLPADGLTMHQLAADLSVSGATASALADRLVAKGLARRGTDPRDRRVVRLAPSPEGADLAQRWRAARRQMIVGLLDRLRDEQVAAWLDIMETLAAEPSPGAAPAEPSPGAAPAGAELAGAGR